MNGVNETLQVAKGISDYGLMIIICAVFLTSTSALIITCFRWFKTVMENIMTDYSVQLKKLQETSMKNGEALIDIAEGLIPETRLRIKTISNAFFDISVEKVCSLIKRIRSENHIANKEATKSKIRLLLTNMYEDRISRFDCFRYRGKKLSDYCNPEWIELVSKVVESEIYNETGGNDDRAYTNVKAVYDNIKLDFYHRLNN